MITLHWVYGLEITTCHYKGLLQEYIMLCYVLPNKLSPLAVLRFPHKHPLLHHVVQAGHKVCHKVWWYSHSTEHDTQPIAYLISKQVIPYRTGGGTCCPMVSTPKIQSLADSSMTWHDGINHLNHCSNHSIDPHHGQLTSRWMEHHLSQRHKPNSTSQRMKDLHDSHDCTAKHN
jgi:hypothetical protein